MEEQKGKEEEGTKDGRGEEKRRKKALKMKEQKGKEEETEDGREEL